MERKRHTSMLQVYCLPLCSGRTPQMMRLGPARPSFCRHQHLRPPRAQAEVQTTRHALSCCTTSPVCSTLSVKGRAKPGGRRGQGQGRRRRGAHRPLPRGGAVLAHAGATGDGRRATGRVRVRWQQEHVLRSPWAAEGAALTQSCSLVPSALKSRLPSAPRHMRVLLLPAACALAAALPAASAGLRGGGAAVLLAVPARGDAGGGGGASSRCWAGGRAGGGGAGRSHCGGGAKVLPLLVRAASGGCQTGGWPRAHGGGASGGHLCSAASLGGGSAALALPLPPAPSNPPAAAARSGLHSTRPAPSSSPSQPLLVASKVRHRSPQGLHEWHSPECMQAPAPPGAVESWLVVAGARCQLARLLGPSNRAGAIAQRQLAAVGELRQQPGG
jgi:hypothetical protein